MSCRALLQDDPRDILRRVEERQRPLSLPARAGEEFGRWLSLVPWQWWVTLTFDPKKHRAPLGERGALEAWAWWLKVVRKRLGHRTEFVLVTERHRSGAVHLHALMVGCGDLSYVEASKFWQRHKGYSDIQGYLPSEGRDAAHYCAKYVAGGSDFSHPRLSRNLWRYFPVEQDASVLDRFRSAFDVEAVSIWQSDGVTPARDSTLKHALKSHAVADNVEGHDVTPSTSTAVA